MKNLSKQLTVEALKRRNETLSVIRAIITNDANKLDWFLKELLPPVKKSHIFKDIQELKSYLINRLEAKTIKKIEGLQNELLFNDNLQELTELTITVEWKKSSMWGSNPTAESYVNGIGNISSGSIGGCGYDKCSTAVARVLNQVPQFRKLMFELKNKPSNINKKNRELFGYGSGYGILPNFEGGVGISCYDRIFNTIGYEFKTVSSGKSFDVYKISKVSAKVQKEKTVKSYNYAN